MFSIFCGAPEGPKIDYEKEIIYFKSHYFDILPSETSTTRCETVITALANIAYAEGVIKSKQLFNKLYLGSTLTKVKNYRCLVSVLNIANDALTILMPRVNVTNL